MFDDYKEIRSNEAHGDVIFWPLIAVGKYILHSDDYDFLREKVGYFSKKESNIKETILSHINRALDFIKENRFIKGAYLINYGAGDWNDALQPAKPNIKKI